MKRDAVAVALALVAVGLVAGALRALDLLGTDTLRTLALVGLGGALAIGLIMALGWAGAKVLGAARPTQPEKQTVIRERILDNRQQQPMIYQLPAPQNGGAFPELLRAAYQAGQLRLGIGQPGPAEAIGEDAGDGWTGEIEG